MKIEKLPSLDERCALRDLEGRLSKAGLLPAPIPQMEPSYLAAGLEVGTPTILLAHRTGQPVAFLSLALRPDTLAVRLGPVTLGRLPYRQLRILGYHGLPVPHAGVLAAMFERLLDSDEMNAHAALAFELLEDDPLCEFLRDLPATLRERYIVDSERIDSFRVELQGSFADYLGTRFRGKKLYNLRRQMRLFTAAAGGHTETRLYTSEEQVSELLAAAAQVNEWTYQRRRGFEMLRDIPRMRGRLTHFARRGQLRAYVLFAGPTPCAYAYGVIQRRRYFFEITGYDERMARLSPGTQLLYTMLEDLFASELIDEFDFGGGFAEYKRQFATCNPTVFNITLYARRPYAHIIRGVNNGTRHLAAFGKRLLRRGGKAEAKPREEVPARS